MLELYQELEQIFFDNFLLECFDDVFDNLVCLLVDGVVFSLFFSGVVEISYEGSGEVVLVVSDGDFSFDYQDNVLEVGVMGDVDWSFDDVVCSGKLLDDDDVCL